MSDYFRGAVLLVGGNVMYLILLVVMLSIAGVAPDSVFTSNVFNFSLVFQVYLAIGGIFAAADIWFVLSLINELNNSF